MKKARRQSTSKKKTSDSINYMTGFGNHFSTEALPDALPTGQNSPQSPPYGLIAEQISGTGFTARRHENQRSWLYRIHPSVKQSPYESILSEIWQTGPFSDTWLTPERLRWNPQPLPEHACDFIAGIKTVAGNGNAAMRQGSAIHLYSVSTSMEKRCFCNADGDLLIVPQQGSLKIDTEFGRLLVSPGEIVVIQRGIKFRINLSDPHASGYILENYGNPFRLPDLGPIGANGLANPRDFKTPVAWFEDSNEPVQLLTKFGGRFFRCELDHSPFDVVAWHGNYAPYKYDLKTFNTINTVSFDHPDPSIFTVLTSPLDHEGLANVDFVIFPPRWMVAENTFRPPWFHRNIMSEYMGLIEGVYDAKSDGGFVPGGGSLHNCMSPHGPDGTAVEQATKAKLTPQKQEKTLAFMFESSFLYKPTAFAINGGLRQENYTDCWQNISPTFNAAGTSK
ncbi:homogentisate 1,2-dioxygenase [Kistimonas asteriae]|uniref:homogentisate 1,2-dioxygenase n=1 Tax=Kistimonas asteriae TaxID=517724 RepID=UPI001BA5812E|nr:homogentisate 1,2-dioxygenase [Kistimonas asteriae]